MVNNVLTQLKLPLHQVYFWTDSTIVLAWLSKHPKSWETFVAHRVATISDTVGVNNWNHVVSHENPADLASRGCTAEELIDNSLWWTGPSWLKESASKWPTMTQPFITQAETQIDILKDFSKWSRALRRKTPLPGKSTLITLTPYLDSKNIIRANGRLAKSSCLSYDERHPIILPYKSCFTRLLTSHVHLITLHGRNQAMLRVIRSGYWIPKLKNRIRFIVDKCTQCTRYRHRQTTQLMAALPPERTQLSRPFCNTGVDFAGPFDIKTYAARACKVTKGYVCVFVCFATKAIHLEPTTDLSTQAFMAAFARFFSRRGCPAAIYSDNGTNFVGACQLLKKERQEFFKCLNSRPLSPSSENSQDLNPLTPGHFLIGSPMLTPAEPDCSDGNVTIANRWQKLRIQHHHFCRRWKDEYLKELHKRYKWKYPQREIAVDDLVVIKHDNIPPNEWSLGRVVKTVPGSDGRIRVVELRTSTGSLIRPITKVVVLPTS
ncbi:uncharacterized protein LOC135949306 [Calliphora vicina]|uniref:uncharacterized protein LOC135949306 n=1 Tax=Calliphora vicina TaxID=7373 RepID=UPI00325B103D